MAINIKKAKQALGFDMVAAAAESRANPSLASGCNVVATSDGGTTTGSPGAVLGTGSNVDRYTPGAEAV